MITGSVVVAQSMLRATSVAPPLVFEKIRVQASAQLTAPMSVAIVVSPATSHVFLETTLILREPDVEGEELCSAAHANRRFRNWNLLHITGIRLRKPELEQCGNSRRYPSALNHPAAKAPLMSLVGTKRSSRCRDRKYAMRG